MFQFSSPSPFLLLVMLFNTLVGIMTSRRRYDVTSVAALIPPLPRSRLSHFALLRIDHSDVVLNRFNAVFGIFR